MPIFEYRCTNCQSIFEKIVFRDSEPIECPGCHGQKTEKLLSTFAVAGSSPKLLSSETGPCHCGAPRRGMCGE